MPTWTGGRNRNSRNPHYDCIIHHIIYIYITFPTYGYSYTVYSRIYTTTGAKRLCEFKTSSSSSSCRPNIDYILLLCSIMHAIIVYRVAHQIFSVDCGCGTRVSSFQAHSYSSNTTPPNTNTPHPCPYPTQQYSLFAPIPSYLNPVRATSRHALSSAGTHPSHK